MRLLDRISTRSLGILAGIAVFAVLVVAQQVGPGGVPGAGGGGGAVSSVFTRTGAVVAVSGDYTCAEVTGCFTNPMTADGDIIFGGTSGIATRLPFNSTGSSAVLLEATGGSAPLWEGASGTGGIMRNTGGAFVSTGTAGNCSSPASPAVCSADMAGSVAVPTGGSTLVVDTTDVTASSQILLTFDSSLGTKLGVTCNTSVLQPTVSARTAGTSFTITMSGTVSTDPACISYVVIN
jgi:hypothetical protein